MVEFNGRSESIFVVTIIFLAISLVAVCLRCFVRLRLVRAFGWDDGLMVAAMVCDACHWATERFHTHHFAGSEYLVRVMWNRGIGIWNGSNV